MLQMEASPDTSNIPTWDGSPGRLDDFADEVELYVLGNQTRCTWNMWAKNRARSRTWARHRENWLWGWACHCGQSADGGQKIVTKFRETLSARPEAG